MPAIYCDSRNRIHAMWHDTRLQPNQTRFYDIFATVSKDGGISWGPNTRVTPTSIDSGAARFIGDYTGITASNDFAHPCWSSGGFNGGEFSTARLGIP